MTCEMYLASRANEQVVGADSRLERAETLVSGCLTAEIDTAALVQSQAAQISNLAMRAVGCIRAGGRLIYAGAGTSGRLAALDAAECPPTFGVSSAQVVALLAGGAAAMLSAIEGAEDDVAAAQQDVAQSQIGPNDLLVAVTASGKTPYTIAALSAAAARGAQTALITCAAERPNVLCDVLVWLPTGREVISGSTRLRAGTATKLALNALSTATFSLLGRSLDGDMVGVRPTNAKLKLRACEIVARRAGLAEKQAESLLIGAGWDVRIALVMAQFGDSFDLAAQRLADAGDDIGSLLRSETAMQSGSPARASLPSGPQSSLAHLAVLRKKTPICVLGLMSGTSADGIDGAVIELDPDRPAESLKVLLADTFTFPLPLSERIWRAGKSNPSELAALDFALGWAFGDVAATLIERAAARQIAVDLIGSHGQTVVHGPSRARRSGYTMQIGQAACIAERTGLPVISDFRSRDVAAGGEGAPLVPLLDSLLLGSVGRVIALQNIGGIANVTVVGPNASDVIAFDCGPGNALIDSIVRIATSGTRRMDRGGVLAARGVVNNAVLAELMRHPALHTPLPRSLDRDLFGEALARELIAKWGNPAPHLDDNLAQPWLDLLATATRFSAEAIARSYAQDLPPGLKCDEVLVSGGGLYNKTMMAHLAECLAPTSVRALSAAARNPISPDAKEAVAFALLAAFTLRGYAGNLASVTGAVGPRVLGEIAL